MKVKPNHNSAVPVQGSETASVKDGTSNTIMVGEQAKPQKPFAKDSFEIGSPKGALDASSKEAGKLSVTINSRGDGRTGMIPRGETPTPNVQNEIDLETKKHELRDENVINSLNVKYTFMDYTDDGD